MLKQFSRPIIFWILICLLFLALRCINLPASINFGSDAARDFFVAWNIYVTKHPVLIGPPSEFAINGRQFFFGPAPYYFILPALILGKWSPLSVSYFLIFLNLTVLLLSLYILTKNIKEKVVLYYFALFCTVTPLVVTYSQSYWNPNFMLPVSILLVALIVKSRRQKDNSLLLLLIGFLFGLGMEFHYSFILAIVVSGIWLFFNKKITLRTLLFLGGGFVIGFFPLIIFELRNNFYNLNTMILFLTHPGSTRTNIMFNTFYLISLIPFLFYFISVLLTKVSRLFVSVFFVGYILVSIFILFIPHRYAMSYPDAVNIVKGITRDNPKTFNIVDQLSGDNRATPVRYLITVQGYIPEGVTDYPNDHTLYVYSRLPLKNLLHNPVWEIKSFLPFKKVTMWDLKNGIFLYKLEK